MRSARALTATIAIPFFVVACAQQGSAPAGTAAITSAITAPSTPTIDQVNICEVKAWQHDDVAAQCKPGQKVVFLPEHFGNEQLPIMFAAVNCDLRYTVALTTGAVTCIYSPITLKPAPPATQSKP